MIKVLIIMAISEVDYLRFYDLQTEISLIVKPIG